MLDLQKWLVKRKKTTQVFTIECLILGMEYSVTFLTLWLYLNTLVNTSHKEMFYSLISASYLVAGVFCTILIGRWVDKSRNIQIIFLICNIVVVTGNLIYILHFSPWFLVAGRLLCGVGGSLRAVISGEVARIYPDEEVISKFSSLGMAFALGFIIGPGVNFLFENVDFQIGPLHITYANAPGLYMAGLFMITQLYCFVNLSNLSKEYDLKAGENFEKEKYNVHSVSRIKDNIFPCNVSESLTSSCLENSQSVKEEALCHVKLNKSLRSESLRSLQNSTKGVNILPSTFPRKGSLKTELTDDSLQQSFNLSTKDHKANYHQDSISIAKLENSELFNQTFTRSDNMLSSTIIILARNSLLHGETLPLLAGRVANSQVDGRGEQTISDIMRQIFSNFDTFFILLLTYFIWFWMVCFDMWLPMMVVDVLKYGITELNGIVLGFGFISAIILFVFSYNVFSDQTIFKISPFFMIALALMELIFIALKMYHENLYMNVALWLLWGVLFAAVIVMDEVFLIGVLAKMTSSSIQTFNESIRLATARLGSLTALLSAVFLFKWLEYVCLVGIAFSLLTFTILILRRRTISNPTVLIR